MHQMVLALLFVVKVHKIFFHMVGFFYQQPSSVIMLRLATHKAHYHVIITLLRELRRSM